MILLPQCGSQISKHFQALIKSDLVLEIKFEGTQISAAAVQEEVQRMNEITKTFLEHKN
jgi:hypothetical protein